MKGIVLTKITPEEGREYIKEFKEITSDAYPRLTMEKLVLLHSEKPILGQVLRGCFDYEEALILEKYKSLDMQRRIWLIAEPFNENHGLGIGCKDDNLEIFQRSYSQSEERYYLANSFPPPSTITRWLIPPHSFLQKTLSSLPQDYQAKFDSLVKRV
jgi:hypothetical protein